jgi:hypothetical protein
VHEEEEVFHKNDPKMGKSFFRRLLGHGGAEQNLAVPKVEENGTSKILRIPNQGEAELLRDKLEQYGTLVYLENHFSEANDVIAKYKKLEESVRAFEALGEEIEVSYVPTKIDSDRVNQYKSIITDSQDDAQEASLALNMLKLGNDRGGTEGDYSAFGRPRLNSKHLVYSADNNSQGREEIPFTINANF